MIRDRLGNHIYGTNTHLKKVAIDDRFEAGTRFHVDFDVELRLGAGSYNVSVAVVDDALHSSHLDWIDQAVVFQVMPDGVPDFAGLTPLPARLSYGLGPGIEAGQGAADQRLGADRVEAGD